VRKEEGWNYFNFIIRNSHESTKLAATLSSVNTHLPTPHLPALTQAHDLYLADAADFSQGWEGWGFMNLS